MYRIIYAVAEMSGIRLHQSNAGSNSSLMLLQMKNIQLDWQQALKIRPSSTFRIDVTYVSSYHQQTSVAQQHQVRIFGTISNLSMSWKCIHQWL